MATATLIPETILPSGSWSKSLFFGACTLVPQVFHVYLKHFIASTYYEFWNGSIVKRLKGHFISSVCKFQFWELMYRFERDQRKNIQAISESDSQNPLYTLHSHRFMNLQVLFLLKLRISGLAEGEIFLLYYSYKLCRFCKVRTGSSCNLYRFSPLTSL